MTDHIHIRTHWYYTLVCSLCLSVVAVVGFMLYVHGEKKHVEGYALGREAERLKNPTNEYIESGLSFCWSEGNYYNVKPARSGFRIVSK